jgi:hypothetical protein
MIEEDWTKQDKIDVLFMLYQSMNEVGTTHVNLDHISVK